MPEAEGERFPFKGQEHIKSEYLQTLDFEGRDQYIRTETEEFVAVCPFSGLPDVARLIIEYYPRGGKCVELKSLKYYVTSFKEVGIYQEEATLRIYRDLAKALETDSLRVTTEYNIRGGFRTTAVQGEL
ncbi:MAG: preQ(1) synthase [Desulfohalobiaceae bacterium]|nr:preQ(1) synthase [Desulfohalobiaceae bacterium]